MQSKRAFTVRYECDDDGAWVVDVIEAPLVHARGSSLAKAEANIRVELARALGAEEGVEVLAADLTLFPRYVFAEIDIVDRATRQREVARLADVDAQALATDAAHQLVDRHRVNRRDAAYLLGISKQRLAQLLDGGPPLAAT